MIQLEGGPGYIEALGSVNLVIAKFGSVVRVFWASHWLQFVTVSRSGRACAPFIFAQPPAPIPPPPFLAPQCMPAISQLLLFGTI